MSFGCLVFLAPKLMNAIFELVSSFVFQKFARNAMFGNLFGVLALHQSNRLSKVSFLTFLAYLEKYLLH